MDIDVFSKLVTILAYIVYVLHDFLKRKTFPFVGIHKNLNKHNSRHDNILFFPWNFLSFFLPYFLCFHHFLFRLDFHYYFDLEV